MSALRRDLFERRLWPLVVVLIAAAVAAPILLLKRGSAGGEPAPAAPHVALPKASAGQGTGRAVKAAGAKLTIAASGLRDPFVAGSAKLAATPVSSVSGSSSASATSTLTSTPSTTATSAATVSPSSTDAASSGTSATTATTVSEAGSSASESSGSTSTASWTIYSVDLRAGTGAQPALRKDVPRLAVLPSAKQPAVVFMGVMAGGRQAAFALASGVQHWGKGLCRPYRQVCSVILLKANQSEHVAYLTDSGLQNALVKLVAIHSRVTHSKSEALSAYGRHSAAGACDLSLGSPVTYSAAAGTLSSAYKAACGTS